LRSRSEGIREKLEESVHQGSDMPDCAEKYLFLLYNHFEYLVIKKADAPPLIETEEEFVAIVQRFKERLDIEELRDTAVNSCLRKFEGALAKFKSIMSRNHEGAILSIINSVWKNNHEAPHYSDIQSPPTDWEGNGKIVRIEQALIKLYNHFTGPNKWNDEEAIVKPVKRVIDNVCFFLGNSDEQNDENERLIEEIKDRLTIGWQENRVAMPQIAIARTQISELKDLIRPVNLSLLLDLTSKNTRAASKLYGKNVTLLCGNSGKFSSYLVFIAH
jgi:hypothetical protein